MTPERLAKVAEALRRHLPKDRYNDDGDTIGTYCTGCEWEGDYFADGDAGPFDDHLAAALAPLLDEFQAEDEARAWEGAADEPGDDNAVPTPAQLLRRLAVAGPDRRLSWAERAIVNSEKAYQCFLEDHRGHIGHLRREVAAAEARGAARVREAVEALHGGTHWCHDADEQQEVFERGTRHWPCPTLAALDAAEKAAVEGVAGEVESGPLDVQDAAGLTRALWGSER